MGHWSWIQNSGKIQEGLGLVEEKLSCPKHGGHRPQALRGERPMATLREQYHPGLVILTSKGFLSRFLVSLGPGPVACEWGICEGHGSSQLRYLVLICGQQLGVCRNGFRWGCSWVSVPAPGRALHWLGMNLLWAKEKQLSGPAGHSPILPSLPLESVRRTHTHHTFYRVGPGQWCAFRPPGRLDCSVSRVRVVLVLLLCPLPQTDFFTFTLYFEP